jgi:hypothetical protein
MAQSGAAVDGASGVSSPFANGGIGCLDLHRNINKG